MDWADPQEEPDEQTMSKVSISNLLMLLIPAFEPKALTKNFKWELLSFPSKTSLPMIVSLHTILINGLCAC